MSRDKKYGWLNPRENSAKTLIEQAKKEVPHFGEHILKFVDDCKDYGTRTWTSKNG